MQKFNDIDLYLKIGISSSLDKRMGQIADIPYARAWGISMRPAHRIYGTMVHRMTIALFEDANAELEP